MPLLEYRCGGCGARVEDLVLAGDTARRPTCSSCGGTDLARLFSTFAARTGSGSGKAGFDAETACGGGACRMPDVCGDGGGADWGDA